MKKMRSNQQKVPKFDEMREDILKYLKLNGKKSGISEAVILVEGFINQPISMEVSNITFMEGPTIPMIMVLGKESGRIYLFSLEKVLKKKIF